MNRFSRCLLRIVFLFPLIQFFPDQFSLRQIAIAYKRKLITIVTSELKGNSSNIYENETAWKDSSVEWDYQMYRPWLDPRSPDPPAMIIMTNFGWNHPNQTYGMSLYRGRRSHEFYEGIVNHPWFHPNGWEEIESGTRKLNNHTRYYMFLDVETCWEKNYPWYGHGFLENRVQDYGRGTESANYDLISLRLQQLSILKSSSAKIILFDCSGLGPSDFLRGMRTGNLTPENLIFLSISNQQAYAGPHDLGLPPPICRKMKLSEDEENNILNCSETLRPILLSFIGSIHRSEARKQLSSLLDRTRIIIGRHRDLKRKRIVKIDDAGWAFEHLARQSAFSAAPRGDNLFSYRFSEVMSVGSIPVIYADDWMLPFGKHLINWTEASVVIPESEVLNTSHILTQINMEQRCRMRQNVLRIFRDYMETGRGVIKGIVESLEMEFSSKE